MRLLFVLLLFLTALSSNNQNHALLTAHQAIKQKDYTTAIKLYEKAAEQDNIQALLELGKIYYQGKIVKRSYIKAYRYFKHASTLGSNDGTYYLGVLYSNKNSSYYDMKEALNIFKSLESTNHAGALNRLGMFYTFGIAHTPKDYKKAVKLFEAASKQGYETAHCNLAYMYATGKGVWNNFGRAHAFAKEGMKKGNEICVNVWKEYKLDKYPQDKGWKFKFYTKPNQ